MDYKYIELLLERYWDCETSVEEERILRTFFQQEELPEHLSCYREVFSAQDDVQQAHLGEDFDKRVKEAIGLSTPEVVTARKISVARRLRPFLQAACLVAIFVVLGVATKQYIEREEQEDAAQVAENADSIAVEQLVPVPERQSVSVEVAADTLRSASLN